MLVWVIGLTVALLCVISGAVFLVVEHRLRRLEREMSLMRDVRVPVTCAAKRSKPVTIDGDFRLVGAKRWAA